jgi:signal transduction histidine kinase
MKKMSPAATKAMIPNERSALLGTADSALSRKLVREMTRFARQDAVFIASRLPDLRERLSEGATRVIFLDEALLKGAPLTEVLRQLTEAAPVVFLASFAWQEEIAQFVAEGDVEFVAREGDYISLIASLIERRLRWAERSDSPLGPPWAELPGDMAEIFRHEINNPLTGILGNAELLLAHRDRMPPVDTQRLQTVVDLAVRLRETVRRLSNGLESQQQSLKSAQIAREAGFITR